MNAGINESGLDNLVLEINNYAENIKKILSEFDDLVQENIQYFDCDAKNKFMAIHNENRYNYSVFEKNILSYANDLMTVKKKWKESINNIALNFK